MPTRENFTLRGTLGETVRGVENNSSQIITPLLTRWYVEHSEDQIPEWVWNKITASACAPPYSSRGRFGGSSAATCKRRQLLTYLGAKPLGTTDARTAAVFSDGKWRHLRWQAMLLMAGIVDDIEVPVSYPKLHVRGSADGTGLVPDRHKNHGWRGKRFGFELKGANPRVYEMVKGSQGWRKYQYQIARYFLAEPTFELFVIIVENKGYNEWTEWVVSRDLLDPLISEDYEELDKLNTALSSRTLLPILSMCQVQKGDVYRNCPYGGPNGACFRAGDWPRRVISAETSKARGIVKKGP